MPNWCANHLDITGEPSQLKALEDWLTGKSPLLAYQRAIYQSIKLLVAGCAGIRVPTLLEHETQPVQWNFPPLPQLVSPGTTGVFSPEDLAFTRWLKLLKCNPALDKHYCQVIEHYWQQSGLKDIRWENLTDAQQETVNTLFHKKYADWFGTLASDKPMSFAELWNDMGTDALPVQSFRMDMRELIPTCLAYELNGFSGGLWYPLSDDEPDRERWRNFQPRSSGYGLYLDLYGIKSPEAYNLHYNRHSTGNMTVDFDSPWSPPNDAVMEALSKRFDCQLVHYYCEEGDCFCGRGEYEQGTLIERVCDELVYGEMDDEGMSEIIGPDYILENISHFGG
ncbi:DUF1281 domain-containing protein [Jinshanibacter sp. LJY008]|uniref:DUF1281 domain-containing protein n=1 Tax=Limnobaculum eriocheiris TaxID=2897391 RepID=A0A9X1MXD2_9GAMM|nr:DUF1281 domain-containing protein [Limnobaculum eriocheiris]MCD1127441.1 DUF1281 domain-containing protein [Limnobaculum eriocheiris]